MISGVLVIIYIGASKSVTGAGTGSTGAAATLALADKAGRAVDQSGAEGDRYLRAGRPGTRVGPGLIGEEMAVALGGTTLVASGEEIAGALPVTVAALAPLTATAVRDGAALRAASPRVGLVRGGVPPSIAVVAASAVPESGVVVAPTKAVAAVTAPLLPAGPASVAAPIGAGFGRKFIRTRPV